MKKVIRIMLVVFMLAIPMMSVAAAGIADNSTLYGEFDCIDGGKVTTQSAGKPKILVFFTTTCSNCRSTLQDLSSSEWIKSGETDVCAIEIGGASVDDVKNYRDTNCSEGMIQFGAEPGNPNNLASRRMAFQYVLESNPSATSYATPVIVMIDAENQLQLVLTGVQSSDTIKQYLDELCPAEETGSNGSDQGVSPDQNGVWQPEGSQEESSGNRQDGSEAGQSSASNVTCDHVGEITIVSKATATSDAIGAYQCVKCGTIYKYEEIPNSAFASFLEETADMILHTQQEEVVIDTKLWVSFNKTVFEAIRNRPDVTVTVNYLYEGNPYVLKIPAGTDVDLLMDENGFGGFRYIEKVLNM